MVELAFSPHYFKQTLISRRHISLLGAAPLRHIEGKEGRSSHSSHTFFFLPIYDKALFLEDHSGKTGIRR